MVLGRHAALISELTGLVIEHPLRERLRAQLMIALFRVDRQSDALTVYHDDCTFETYTAGQSFTDLGCGDIHNVRNETGAEAKDIAVQLVPHMAPRRIEADDPGCPNVLPCPPL